MCQDINQAILLLATSSGERRLTNVLHLAELVQAKAMSMDGEHAVIRWFVRQLETPDAGADEGILRLESDEKLVKVVTVHKSRAWNLPWCFCPLSAAIENHPQKTIHWQIHPGDLA